MHGNATAQGQIDPLYPNRSLPGGTLRYIILFAAAVCEWECRSSPKVSRSTESIYRHHIVMMRVCREVDTFSTRSMHFCKSQRAAEQLKWDERNGCLHLTPCLLKITPLWKVITFKAFSGMIVTKMTSEPNLARQLDCSDVNSEVFVVVTKQESS